MAQALGSLLKRLLFGKRGNLVSLEDQYTVMSRLPAVHTLRDTTLLVYTEILFNPLYEGGAIYSKKDQYLRACGHVLYDIYKPRYDRNGVLMWGNAIFVHAQRLGL